MSNYVCKKCGSTEFSHEITQTYKEVFDSAKKTIVIIDDDGVGGDWRCKNCGAKIPAAVLSEFLSQLYKASTYT